jgi:predicted phosphodiesterase
MGVKIDQEEAIRLVRELAIELGRTPAWNELHKVVSKHHIYNLFGNQQTLIKAAGLEPAKHGSRKIDNTIFNVKIEDHLDKYTKESDVIEPIRVNSNNYCVISDIHWPFHHAKKMDLFFERAEKKKYDLVIINGDARDMYSHAAFPRSHNVFTPREENELARKLNQEFWNKIKKFNKNTVCIQTTGNHSVRPMKRILEEYPAAEDWIAEAMKREFTFEGVTTLFNPRDFVLLNDEIAVMHGYKSQLGAHRDQHLMSCIIGHTHRPGIVYRRMVNKIIFEANSGFMGNPAAKGLTYTSSKLTEWVNGILEGDKDGIRFIAL